MTVFITKLGLAKLFKIEQEKINQITKNISRLLYRNFPKTGKLSHTECVIELKDNKVPKSVRMYSMSYEAQEEIEGPSNGRESEPNVTKGFGNTEPT